MRRSLTLCATSASYDHSVTRWPFCASTAPSAVPQAPAPITVARSASLMSRSCVPVATRRAALLPCLSPTEAVLFAAHQPADVLPVRPDDDRAEAGGEPGQRRA